MKRLSIIFTTLLLVCNLSSPPWSAESPTQGSSPRSIEPFQIHSADSSVILGLRFAGQLRADGESTDQEEERTDAVSMQARRVRPSMTLELPRQRISVRLHLSTAPRSLELMDMYFNYGLSRHVQFRAGQYKVPFTRYRIQSFQRLTFVDWAIVTRYFGAERQMGFSFHNGYEKPPRVAHAFGVFSGVNARASHAVGLSNIYGEETVNPSDLSSPGPRAEFHPELVGHFSYNTSGIQVRSDSDEQRCGLRHSLGMSWAWDLDPDDFRDLALRAALELLIKYQGASFMSAGYAGFVNMNNSRRTRLAMVGLLVQTSFRVAERYELSLRYAVVDFDKAVVDDAFARASQLISEAEQQLEDSATTQHDVDDLKERYHDAGCVLKEQEITAGFNIYLRGHSLKWQNDFGWLRHSLREGDTRDDLIVRSQFQVAF